MPLTLSGTNGVSGIDGSNTTPAVRGSDTNTGFVFGADIIQVIEGGSESARFDASGNLLVGVTSANANGGVLQLKSGITFPATQVSASDVNTLDDYEEGTWTPVYVGSSSAGSCTYGTRQGSYRKIGNYVYVQCYIVTQSTHSGTGGNICISGLPFTSASTYGGGMTVDYKLSWVTNGPDFAQLEPSNGYLYLRRSNNTGQTDVAPSGVQNGTELMVFGCYIASA